MKTFKGHKQETLLLIEESDLDYIIAPLSAKDNEDFMKQALCCISIEEALEFYQLIYRAVKENAYIHPGWDYLRYPSVTIKSIE